MLLASCSNINSLLGYKDTAPVVKKLVALKHQDFKIKPVWSTKILGYPRQSRSIKLTPYIVKNYIFTINPRGYLVKTSLATGKRVWDEYIKEDITGAIGGNQDLIFVVNKMGKVYAIKQTNGQVQWTANLNGEVLSVPAVSKNLVVINLENNNVIALDVHTGKKVWENKKADNFLLMNLHGESSPVIKGDQVFVGNTGGQISSLNLNTGVRTWQSRVAFGSRNTQISHMVDIVNKPYVDGERVYGASYKGNIAAFDKKTGSLLWSNDLSTLQDLGFNRQIIVATAENGHVIAFNKKNGKKLWEQDKLAYRSLTGPLVFHDHVFVGDMEGYMHVLSVKNGKIMARNKLLNTPILNKPLVNDNVFYVTGERGKLVAFKLLRTLPRRVLWN